MRSRAYRSVSVKDVKMGEIVQQLAEGAVYAGLDVGKDHVMVAIRDSQGTTLRPWKVRQTAELPLLVDRLDELSRRHSLLVAMEPTGTYGDPLRQTLGDAGLMVHQVSAKSAKDYAEIIDGVPSQHDGKDAAVVAELASIGKSRPWPLEAEVYMALRHDVQWLDSQQDILQLWLGRIEGLLARHWPELTGLLALDSNTLLQTLAHYGSPQAVREDREAAAQLARWGGPLLKREKIAAVLASARETLGVRMQSESIEFVQRCAEAALEAEREIRRTRRALERRAASDPDLQRVGQAVGVVTSCVLFAILGNPRNYLCGEAYRKAMGLNLKERSSGRHQGHLKITKRGPSIVRRWLYFAALRYVRHPAVRPWYERKKERCQGYGSRGVVAVMRKLALAVYAVANGATFEPARLFPGGNLPSSWRRQPPAPGALPPDPRNLSPEHHSRSEGNETAAARDTRAAARSAAVTGEALGSVSTGALSSAPAEEA